MTGILFLGEKGRFNHGLMTMKHPDSVNIMLNGNVYTCAKTACDLKPM